MTETCEEPESDCIFGTCMPGGYPCIDANVSDAPAIAIGLSGNRTDCPIEPGELILHPLNTTGNGERCRAALVFTVPRTARYSLSAKFRSINAVGTGVSDAWILLDNSPIFTGEINHSYQYGELPPYAFTNAYLVAGQTLAFVVGPGYTEWAHAFDGVALKLELVEHDQSETPVTQVWDMGESLRVNCAGAAPALPFPDASGTGEWNCLSIRRGTLFDESMDAVIFPHFATNANSFAEFYDGEGDNKYPYLQSVPVSDTGAALDTRSSGVGMIYSAAVQGEMCFHPGSNRDVVFRFTVPSAGRYVVSYTMRDGNSGGDLGSKGVGLRMVCGGLVMPREVIALESCGFSFRQEETPPLAAGAHIDFILDNNGDYTCDSTAGRLKVYKLADSIAYTNFNAGVALRENVAGAYENPFTDARGVTWSVGSCGDPGTAFVLMTTPYSSQKQKGWKANPGGDWWSGYPLLVAPVELGQYGPGEDDWVVAGQELHPNEFCVHPFGLGAGQQCAVVRFAAPHDGAYRVVASARDINPGAENGGVACHLMVGANNLVPAQIAFIWPEWKNWGGYYTAVLESGFVNLRKDETIDLAVGGNWSPFGMGCDATAVQEVIYEGEAKDDPVLSIDLRAEAGRLWSPHVYTAQGRVGWSGQTWTETARVEDALAVCGIYASTKASTQRTGAAFTLTRNAGAPQISALGMGTLMDAGVVSGNADDVYTFTLTGLLPDEPYTLYLYGLNVENGDGVARFACGDVVATPSLSWFTDDYLGRGLNKTCDTAVLRARSDADGTLTCTFATTSATNPVAFCGLQVEGRGFTKYLAPGTFLTIR